MLDRLHGLIQSDHTHLEVFRLCGKEVGILGRVDIFFSQITDAANATNELNREASLS